MVIEWFENGGALKISSNERSDVCVKGFSAVDGLLDLVQTLGLAGAKDPATMVAACELILEGLVAQKRISRSEELGYSKARHERRQGPGKGQDGMGPWMLA